MKQSVKGYVLSSEIYSSDRTLVARARRIRDGQEVILKLPLPQTESG